MTCMQLAQGNLIRRFENAMSKDVFEVVDKLPGILKPMITFKAIAQHICKYQENLVSGKNSIH